MNYYQVHPNKKPRNLRHKNIGFRSSMAPLMALTQSMAFFQIEKIKSQPLPRYTTGSKWTKEQLLNYKKLQITQVLTELALKMPGIIKDDMKIRFMHTRRYTNKQKKQ